MKRSSDLVHSRKICFDDMQLRQETHWLDVRCSQSFRCSYLTAGRNIIIFQGDGFADFEGEVKSVNFGQAIIDNHLDPDKPFIMIQDWSRYRNASHKARKYFIDNLVKNKRLKGIVFCNTTPLQAASVSLGSALNVMGFQGWLEDDLSGALRRALSLLETAGTPCAKAPSNGRPIHTRLSPGGLGESTSTVSRCGWLDRLRALICKSGKTTRPEHYINDLLVYLQNLDWEGPVSSYEVHPSHPLLPIFDALTVAKSRLEKTFEEREQVEQALRRSEARNRELMENANSIIIRWDQTGRITFFNKFAQSKFGFDKNEILGKPLKEILVPHDEISGQNLADWQAKLTADPTQYEYQVLRNTCSDGSNIWVAWTFKAFMDEDTGQVEVLGIGSDVSVQRKAEEELKRHRQILEDQVEQRTRSLRQSEERYREIFENAPVGIFHCSTSGELTGANSALAAIMGFESPEAMLSKVDTLDSLVSSGAEETWSERMYSIPVHSGWHSFEQSFTGRNHRPVIAGVTVRLLGNPAQGLEGFLVDVTHQKQAQKLLLDQAERDELTGLYNRRKLMSSLRKEFERSCRYHHPLTVAMLDLDHFKQVNDRYGHDVGDQVLRSAARCICDEVRQSDICGRYGGEEFCLVLPHTGQEEAHAIMERLRNRMAKAAHKAPMGSRFTITASVGLAQMNPETDSEEQLLHMADQALYLAKNSGRNRVCVASE